MSESKNKIDLTMSVVMQDVGLVYHMLESLKGDEDIRDVEKRVKSILTDNMSIDTTNNILSVKY